MDYETIVDPSVFFVDSDDQDDNSEQTKLFIAARRWHRRGLNVVPQSPDGAKHPGVSWKVFQEYRLTEDELIEHFHLYTKGVGFITGGASGVIVIESDGPEGEAVLREFEALYGALPATRKIRSGSGRGFHYHFRHPGYPVKTVANESIKLDVRGDGGFCMLPPSLHKSGGRYEVVHDVEPADLPEDLLHFIETKAQEANASLHQSAIGARTKKYKTLAGVQPNPTQVTAANNLKVPIIVDFPLRPVEEMAAMMRYLVSKNAFERRLGSTVDAAGRLTGVGWVETGMALKAAYGDTDGFYLWSISHNSPEAIAEAPNQWASFPDVPKPGGAGLGTLFKAARDLEYKFATRASLDTDTLLDDAESSVTIDNFHAHMPTHQYLFGPTGEMWPATSVNARVKPIPAPGGGKPILATMWLDQNRPIEQMTWAPGESKIINDRLASNGGWIEHKGAHVFNLYRPPNPQPSGIANKALRWLKHLEKVYPDDWIHVLYWLAHRVQRPGEKINHALLLGGSPGIGKDTILEPVRRAIGTWNFEEVSPQTLLSRFNGFLKSVILRVNEAHDLGDMNRFQFHDHMKTYTASPPETLRIDEKHLREYYIQNVCGVIITTNHKTEGIYLPPDDRRHYVAWSEATRADFDEGYWQKLWKWYENGGYAHVAAFLSELDISSFDPKASPPQTRAFWDIANAHRAPEDAQLADAIEKLGDPDALTLNDIKGVVLDLEFGGWLRDRRNNRAMPHRLEKCGYVAVHSSTKDGIWKVKGSRTMIYARQSLTLAEQLAAATELTRRS